MMSAKSKLNRLRQLVAPAVPVAIVGGQAGFAISAKSAKSANSNNEAGVSASGYQAKHLAKPAAKSGVEEDSPTLKVKQANQQSSAGQVSEDSTTIRYPSEGSFKEIVTAQETHIGTRKYQQDAVYASDTVCFTEERPGVSYGILCDGMGGLDYGSEVSELVVREFAQALDNLAGSSDSQNIRDFLVELACALDARIYAQFDKGSAGTTLAAVYLSGNLMHWISAGDSRIYLLRDGSLTQLTRDHNLLLALMNEVSKGNITAREALEHPKKDALISYLGSGCLEIVDANQNPFSLVHGDILLLCSDGLTKSLTDEQICSLILANYGNVKEAARLLPLVAFDTGGAKDNTSVILLQYFD
jgi:protein phosphatase